MIDIGQDLFENRHKVILILIILIIIYLFTYTKIEKRKESFEITEREMYVPNCNFLTDINVCNDTKGCQVIDDKCYYDWINLQ